MKKSIILVAAVALVFGACQAGGGSMKSEKDSVAYALGVDFGNYLKTLDSTLNVNIVASAMKAMMNNNAKMDIPVSHAFLQEYFSVRKPKYEKEASEAFLAKVEKENKNAFKTESGLIYEILREGTGKKAENNDDVVRVMYKGSLRDGKVFDSSYGKDTIEFALNRVIPGWSEGIKLLSEGGQIRLWIPPQLGYGEYGPQGIGPNQALVFDVELFQVKPAPPAEIPAVEPVKKPSMSIAPKRK